MNTAAVIIGVTIVGGQRKRGAPIMGGDPGRNFWKGLKNKHGRGYGSHAKGGKAR